MRIPQFHEPGPGLWDRNSDFTEDDSEVLPAAATKRRSAKRHSVYKILGGPVARDLPCVTPSTIEWAKCIPL